MNYEEFLSECSLLKEKGWSAGFFVIKSGRKRIWLWPPQKEIGSFCPITAVCFVLTGQKFDSNEYLEASRALGFPVGLAREIAGVADDDLTVPENIRPDLIKAFGL